MAVVLIAEDDPDVVLTDLDMPRLTGLELCHALRGHHDHAAVPSRCPCTRAT